MGEDPCLYYTYRVTWSAPDGAFCAQCAEFPSLSWMAESRGQAVEGAARLVSVVLKQMEGAGEEPPGSLGARHYSGKFMLRITPEQHRALTAAAAEAGVSLNRYIASQLP